MRVLFFFLALGVMRPAFAETVNVRFDDLAGLVKTGNKTVLAQENYVDGAKARTGHLGRSFLPNIKASGGGEIFKTGNFDKKTQPVGEVEGKLNLFRSGKDGLEGKILSSKLELSKTNYRQAYMRELSRARMLYADILYYQELLHGINRSASLTQGHRDSVAKRLKAGLTTPADDLEFEMFSNRLKQEKILAEEDQEHAVEELKAVLGLDHEAKISLSATSSQDKSVLAAAFNPAAHPEVTALKKKEEISRYRKRQAGRWWAPYVDLYGGYALYPFREREYNALNNRDETVGGVRVTMDIFDGLHSASESKSLKYEERGLNLEASQTEREIGVLFEKLQHELKSRRALLVLAKQNGTTGEKYLQMSADEYTRGVKDGPQLLEASQRFFDEKSRLANAKRDYFQVLSMLLSLLER